MNAAAGFEVFAHGERSASEADAKKDRESVGRTPANTAHAAFPASGEKFQIGRWCANAGIGSESKVGVDSDGRSRAQRGEAVLPCQNSNNSNQVPKRYRLQRVPGADGLFRAKGDNRGIWKQVDGDTIERWGKPTAAEAKSAFHLRLNVAAFVEHWGRNHCLFFTVTDKANLHPTKFARRWNSYRVRNAAWVVSFIRVAQNSRILLRRDADRPHRHAEGDQASFQHRILR